MSTPGSARGPRPEVLRTRYEQYRNKLDKAKQKLGDPPKKDCDTAELGRAADDLRARWRDLCCRSRLLTRQVCPKNDKVLEGGHDHHSAAVRALLASVWINPETIREQDLGRVPADETRPTLGQLRSTPPEAYLCACSWDREEPTDFSVLWPEQVENEKALEELLGGVLGDGELRKLWKEYSENNCRLVRHRPTDTVYRVAHACNVLLSRQEWIRDKDSRQDQVVLELYDLNEEDEFRRKGQPPSVRLSSGTSITGNEDELFDKARLCLEKELGVERTVIDKSVCWKGAQVHAMWNKSPSYSALKTLYIIHMVDATIQGLPESPLFQTVERSSKSEISENDRMVSGVQSIALRMGLKGIAGSEERPELIIQGMKLFMEIFKIAMWENENPEVRNLYKCLQDCFDSLDKISRGTQRRHYWQWCPRARVPMIASMEEDYNLLDFREAGERVESVSIGAWNPSVDDADLCRISLLALVEREELHNCSIRPLHGGKSGSIVVQLRGYDEHGRPCVPAVAKIDFVRDKDNNQVLKAEQERHNAMRELLGSESIPRISAYVQEPSGKRAAMLMELAGAAYFNPDLNPYCHIVELADLFCHQRDTENQAILPSGALAELPVLSVIHKVFGSILADKNTEVKPMSLMNPPGALFGRHRTLREVFDDYAPPKTKVEELVRTKAEKMNEWPKYAPHLSAAKHLLGDGASTLTKLHKFRAWLDKPETKKTFDRPYVFSAQHGDLNLKNILIDSQKVVWLIDFAHSGTEGVLTMKDLCKFESCILLEYFANKDTMPTKEKEFKDIAKALYGPADGKSTRAAPWERELPAKDDLVSRSLAEIRRHVGEVARRGIEKADDPKQAGRLATSCALQHNVWILFYVLKALRFDDVYHPFVAMVAALVSENLMALAETNPLCAPTFPDGRIVASMASEEFEYVRSLFLRFSTISDAMTGERLDILQQCATVEIMETEVRGQLDQRDEQYAESLMDRSRLLNSSDNTGADSVKSSQSAVRWILEQESSNHLLVLGKPAGGKTVLLKQLVLIASMSSQTYGWSLGQNHHLVVFVALVELLQEVERDAVPIEDWMDVHWNAEYGSAPQTLAFLQEAYKNYHNYRFLVLLDGMDEVQEDRVGEVVRFMEVLAARGYRLVVSTRPTRWATVTRAHFGRGDRASKVWEDELRKRHGRWVPWRWDWSFILDLDDRMQERLAKLRMGPKRDEAFLSVVRAHEDYKELAKSPLLLSLLMHQYKDNKESLPKNRSSLYQACVEDMLFRLEKNKGTKETNRNKSMGKNAWLEFMGNLAYRVHHVEQTRDFVGKTAAEVNATIWDELEPDARFGRIPLLPCIGLDGEDRPQFRFVHLTFQEYLMAHRMRRDIRDAVERADKSAGLDELATHAWKAFSDHFGGEVAAVFGAKNADWYQQVVRLLVSSLEGAAQGAFLAAIVAPLKGKEHGEHHLRLLWRWICRESGAGLFLGKWKDDGHHSSHSLKSLCLSRFRPSAQDLSEVGAGLCSASGLSVLELAGATLDGPFLNGLQGCVGLNRLELPNCRIDEKAAVALGASLRAMASLTYLDLSHNPLNDEGMSEVAKGFSTLGQVEVIVLKSTGIKRPGCEHLVEALEPAVFKTLKKVYLEGNSFDDECCEVLERGLKRAEGLAMVGVSIDKALTSQRAIGLLKSLPLSGDLDLKGTRWSVDDLNRFAEVMKANVTLKVRCSLDWVYEAAVTLLLQGAEHRTTKSIRNGHIGNTLLTKLNLRRNGVVRVDKDGISALAAALKVNTSLKSLDFGENSIGPEGGSALAEALKVNASLTTLDIGYNSIGPEGGSALAEALKVNASLTDLNLIGNNNIEPEGGSALAEALKVNASLTSLNLYHNCIGPEGGSALAEALKVNASLTTLDIGYNSIGDAGSSALAEALKVNASLKSLDCIENSIGPEGGSALAEALKVNASLTSVDLYRNWIGREGVSALHNDAKISASLCLEDNESD